MGLMEDLDRYKSNIWKYYVASLLGGFAFFYNAIDTLYYRHWSLSFEQVGWLIGISMVTTLLLEIPTGAFADLYGKKKSILIASLFNFLGIGCLALGSSFPIFLIGFAFWGVSTAFSSGAGNAWLYDALKALGKEKTLTKYLGRLSSMFISVDILSSILAPLLFALNVRLPYYVALIAMLIVITVQLSMFEKETKVLASGLELIKENLKQITSSISLIRGNTIFIWLTFLGFIFFASNKAISEIVSGPFLTTVAGYSVPTLSIILSIASLIQTITVFFADKFEDKLGLKWSLVLLLLLFPLSIMLYSLTRDNVILTALIVGFYFSLVSFSEVVFESNLSHRLPDNKRATLLSVNSMIVKTATLLVLPAFGLLVDNTSIQKGLWSLGGCIFLIGLFVVLAVLPKLNTEKEGIVAPTA